MPAPKDYVDVAERVAQFKEKYPNGSLQSWLEPQLFMVGDKTYIAYGAAAFRTPDDKRPGIGWAWEPVPGPTPFTKDSELQNAETSAWGRAIVALGFETKHIASAEEVRNRQSSEESGSEFQAPQSAAEKPVTKGTADQITLTLKLLDKAFPEHPGEGRTWKDEAKAHTKDRFQEESVADLSEAQAVELNDWLEEKFNEAQRDMSIPFEEPAA